MAVEGKLPVGFYALTGSGSRLVLEHLWVSPRCLGAGVGRKLFQHAVKTATKLNASVIEIESDPNAEGFYVRMGARRVGETLWEIEGQVRFLPRLIFEIRRHVE